MKATERAVRLAALAVLASLGGIVVLSRTAYVRTPETPFLESAVPAGLDFKMAFLPTEQGENFKVNLYDHGCGIVVGDYDGDGHDDVLLLNQLGSNGLFKNRGDGTFVDVTSDSPCLALGDRICVGGAFADYDNDGDQDLYITSTRGGNVLLENTGGGKFRDVTMEAGARCVMHSESATFFDYDNDGDLDLLVTNTAKWTSDTLADGGKYYLGPLSLTELVSSTDDLEENKLLRNNGDRTFSDVTHEAGLEGKGWCGDVAIFDCDDDGDLDVFVTRMFGDCHLYRNDGRGHFVDAMREVLGRSPFGSVGCKAFDYDNDGRLDLFVTDMHSDMWMGPDDEKVIEPGKKYRSILGRVPELHPDGKAEEEKWLRKTGIDYGELIFGNALYHNEGGGRFNEVSDSAGMETFWPWGIAAGDFDNDGYEDAFLTAGMGYPFFYWPSSLMMNNGKGAFLDAAAGSGIEPPPGGTFLEGTIGGRQAARSSRCAATADFDADGRLDLVVNNFNDRPFYFKNRFPEQNFARFRLVGTRSNRDAVGAVMKIYCGPEVMVRQVHPAGGYLSQSSKTLHFGLGARPRIDRAEILWPSGIRQTIVSPPLNKLTEIHEPDVSSTSPQM